MNPFTTGMRRKIPMPLPRRGALCSAVALSLLFGAVSFSYAGKSGKNISFAGSRQGHSVGFVDIDGDRVRDKVVGAPYASKSSGQGAVLVYRGNEAGEFSGTPSLVLTGDDNLGFSFVNLGDSNDDGHEDFAVGAMNGDGHEVSLSGSVTVYQGGREWNYGKGKGKIIAKLAGEAPLDKFGVFATAGDLNNDGILDLIVGAPFHTPDPSVYQGGAVYVFFAPDFSDKVTLHATTRNRGLGWSAAAGDINGDAIADLCLGASGKVLCYAGGDDFAPETDSPDVTITSASKGFGKALAVVDLSGDGTGELVIGDPSAVVNGASDTGRVSVFRGGPDLGTVNGDGPSAALMARIDGSALFERFGASLAGVAGIAGTDALLVGAPMADLDPFHHLSGKVYFFQGEINDTTTQADAAVFSGFTRNQGYGTSLAVDDRTRLLCGAPRTDRDTGWVSLVDLVSGQ